jgi:O-antigen/teichoic acid export membrane protein
MLATFLLALPLIPVLVLVRTKQAMVRGLMRLGRGQVAEGLVLPATFLGLLTLMALDLVPRDPRSAMALQVVASLAALAWAASVLRASLPPEVRDAPAELARSHWWQASLTMFFITAVRVVNSKADVLLLGAFQGAESVGLYNAAARGAELTTLPVVVAGVILAPRFASLHARGAHDELWKLFWIGTAAMALSSAPLAGGLLLFGEQALGLFGPEFPAGNRVMTILVLGQWLTAATGPAGPMLVMTGRERITMGWVVGGTMLNVTLNLLLIPTWGAEGAALATATSMGVLNLGLLLHAWVRLAGHRREGRA